MDDAQDPAERWSWLGLAVGALGLGVHSARLQPWTLDDAYISFRYAENFAGGHGLVYNPGEWVEGYTTPLWVFLLGWGHTFGLDTGLFAKVAGLGFALGTLLLLARSHRVVPGIDARTAGLAAMLTGTCGVFTSWGMPGMEVPLVGFLLTATSLLTLRSLEVDERMAAVAGGVGGLAMMARPDSIVWVAVCMGALLLAGGRRRALLLGPLATVAVYGPFFAWRFFTYGWLLPNTFYAKVGATGDQVWRGVAYLADAGGVVGGLVVAGLIGLPLLRRHRWAALLWCGGLLHGAYVVAVGGDVMPAFRFLAGILPSLSVVAALGLVASRFWKAGAALLVVGNLVAFELHPDLRPRIEKGVVGRNGEEVGRWLKANFPADTVLATNTAGSVPYFSGFRTIDMLGLNDAHIAHREMPGMGKGRAGHEKADGAYVFERDPDVVQFGSARGRKRPVFRSDRELRRQPGFEERYAFKRYRLPSGANLELWVRRTWVESGRAP